nr:diguanylate cyclase [Qipengyuania polymorpha]
MVVEKPRTYAIAREARLVGEAEAAGEHYYRSLIYALLCGLLIVPIVYDLFFMRLLRFRFVTWHAVMTLGMLGFVLSNSGLIFLFFPDIPLGVRWQLNTVTLAVLAGAAIFFVLSLLEKGKVPKKLSNVLIGFTALMLVIKALSFLDLEELRILSHIAFLYAMLPMSITLLVVIATALLNESRGAIYLLFAFGGFVIAGILALLTNLNLYHPPFHVDELVFAALVLLVLGSSAAVGDRFMVLRVERDRARIRAIKLGRIALTDSLTGLANRRAFDAIEEIGEEQALLVADIDHFKAINDEKGHTTGDAVLCHMASIMREEFAGNPASTIYRLGGEEFAIVFSCTDEAVLRQIAEDLRRNVDGNIGEEVMGIPHATISIGCAMGGGRTPHEVFEKADEALYKAKRAGRNRSAIADSGGRIEVIS